MLKLKPWAFHAILAVQCLFFVNGLLAICRQLSKPPCRRLWRRCRAKTLIFPEESFSHS